MLVPIKWLKDYINIDIDIKDFADKMTLTGTKVEAVEYRGEGLKNIVAGKVLEIEKHPDSDHMWICKIDQGDKIATIVTGAQNVAAGDIIPVAKDNSVIAGAVKIKTSKLRGVVSEGMLCSAAELGISSSIAPKYASEGIYILPIDTKIGEDITEILGLNDYVIDFELTNNRQDCNSILGIAYEANATLGREFVFPAYEYTSQNNDIDKYLKVEVENYDLCRRYTARMVKILKVEPSPLWMQIRLMGAGIRPINNIVDVSNFVMLETGQPLHTFDYNKLQDGKIIVKNASDGEVMNTLDGIERKLNSQVLMIDDGRKHVAIAGIMGGGNSDIDEHTNMVVIESANFEKNTIRQSAKQFGLRTESSAHFEKGISIHLTKYAADRAASLLVEIGAAEYIDGIIDKYQKLDETIRLSVDTSWVSRFIGINFSSKQIADCLNRLGFKPVANGNMIEVTVPKFRQDILIKEDIAEEIVRMYGYNNIPNTLMASSNYIAEPNKVYDLKCQIKDVLVSAGGHEILTYSFVSPEKLLKLGYDKSDIRYDFAQIINPLGEENSAMRTTLITGLLDALSVNFNRKNNAALMFEIGGVYYKDVEIEKGLPAQFEKLCFGKFNSDFYEIKSVAQYLFGLLNINNITYIRSDEVTLHPGRSADILAGEKKIGYVGQVHPLIAKEYDLTEDTVIAEIDVQMLIDLSSEVIIKMSPLAKYPSVQRDLALVCNDAVMAGEIRAVIIKSAGKYLINCEAFDVYKNESLGIGKKSIAFSLTFRSDNATLTDKEVDESVNNILNTLKEKMDIVIR